MTMDNGHNFCFLSTYYKCVVLYNSTLFFCLVEVSSVNKYYTKIDKLLVQIVTTNKIVKIKRIGSKYAYSTQPNMVHAYQNVHTIL